MNTANALAKQAKLRETLLGLLGNGEKLFSELQPEKLSEIVALRQKVLNENLHVVVLGSFKRGKSTFINALLGEEILPSYATPCTAVINEVKWGETKKAVVHFRSIDELTSLQKLGLASLPEKARKHLKRFKKGDVEPLEIQLDELEEYVVIKDPGNDTFESINDLPYDHVEIFWDLPLLKNGVVIIDSPGLDECESRTRITERYLGRADAILYVQSCVALAGQTEMDFIDNSLISNGYEDLLFICNRFDEIKAKERQRVVAYGREKLGAKTNLGDEGVFFLSASDALEGRLQKDEKRIDGSGIIELERRLYTMLVSSRGKTKLIQPTRFFAQELAKLAQTVHTSRLDAREKVQDLQYRLKEYRRHAEREVVQIHKTLEKLQNDLLQIVHNAQAELEYFFFNQFYPSICQEYTEYQPTAIGMSYFFSEKEVRRKRIREVANEIKKKIASIFATYQKEMDKFLQDDTALNESAENYIALAVERVADSIHRLQAVLEGGESSNDQVALDVKTLKLDKLPKLSDAKVFANAQHKQDISKLLQSVGIDGDKLHGRSLNSFFSCTLVDYFQAIDRQNIDHVLKEGNFPIDDINKETKDLKMAIGQFVDNRMEEKKSALLGTHTRFWDSSVTAFIETLETRISQRLEQLHHKAAEQGQELSALQETQSASDALLKEIYSIRTSLGDLTYDLAVS